MTQVGETEVVAGNVRDIVNRLSRDMTGRNPYSVHQQVDRRPTAPSSSQPPQLPLYVVTYPYTATQPDELSFAVGDIIELIAEVEDGWSRGRLKSTGATGMFPTNFVTLKPVTTTPTGSTPPSTTTSSSTRPKTAVSEVVMRNEPKAIERTPSTIISDPAPVLKAQEIKATTFAASTLASASTESVADSGKTKEMARVKFVYVPQHGDELALADIDVLLNITNKNCGDAGWFEGELHGKKGLFPDNFVELVQVPLKTESGAKWSSVSRNTALSFSTHKPPPQNPPQPAVPPKPAKISTVDSAPTSSSLPSSTPVTMPSVTSSSGPLKNNFAALREKMSTNLKVVAPEQVAAVQLKPSEQRDRAASMEVPESSADTSASADQVAELQHITKNRARPPKNRPMSMVMNRNRSSDESPSGRLSSPTSGSSINPMSASMFIPAAAKEITIPSNTSSPFKTAAIPPVVPPSSSSKPPLRLNNSNSLTEASGDSTTHIRKVASPEHPPINTTSTSDFVSRTEYDALLERFRVLESRVIALERLLL